MDAKLDESRLAEIQSTNTSIMADAESAVVALEVATREKRFNPQSDSLLQDVANQGKEVSRRLDWWLKEFIGPVVKGAYDQWKDLCSRRDLIAEPLQQKKDRAALAVGAYKKARDEFQKSEEDRITRERLKAEEDERLKKAQELQDSGRAAEADEVLEEPIHVAPAILPGAPETKGTTFRQNWKYQIIDPDKIPREYLMPDTTKIGMQVRTTKEKTNIPGVRVYSEEKAGFSSRS